MTERTRNVSGSSAGPAIDRTGMPVIDPTLNVMALVQAAVKAQEDLRQADLKFNDAQFRHHTEMALLRATFGKDIRASDLNAAEKTRQVDVLAGTASAAALATAVSALQATSDRNAETLRNQLNATAATMAKQTADAAAATQLQTDNLFRRTDERVAALERGAATGAGRQSVADPQTERLMTQMEMFMAAQAKGTGKAEGVNASWVILLGAVSLVGTLLGVASFIYSSNRAPATAPQTTPQIVYLPSPAAAVVPPATPSK
ncbi:MAG: hypothetical protein ABI790_05395 [Betaproteobacteria bacterium]